MVTVPLRRCARRTERSTVKVHCQELQPRGCRGAQLGRIRVNDQRNLASKPHDFVSQFDNIDNVQRAVWKFWTPTISRAVWRGWTSGRASIGLSCLLVAATRTESTGMPYPSAYCGLSDSLPGVSSPDYRCIHH